MIPKGQAILFFPILLMALFTTNATAANDRLLEKLHGGFIDSCKGMLNCKQADLDRCITAYRKAFEICDPVFHKDPEGNSYPDCIAKQTPELLIPLLSGTTSENCSPKDAIPYNYVSEATRPPDNPQALQFFTDNTFDWSNIILYSDKATMCHGGALKAEESIEKKGKVDVEIVIAGFKHLYHLAAGQHDGDPGYSHVFSTPAYEWGECYGTMKSKILESHSGFRKGEIITADYKDRIFVAVQCHKEPMHDNCEKD